jgi:hypothetical protein
LLLAAVAVVAWVTVDVLSGGPWTRLDHRVSRHILDLGLRQAPWPKNGVFVLTMFGGRGEIVVVLGGFCVVVSWLRRSWQPVIRFVTAIVILSVIVFAFKYGVGRTAPWHDRLHAGGTSYPSGHVPNAILTWGLVAWIAADYCVVRWLRVTLDVMRFAAPAFAFAGMLLLDYHWLSDLVAGVAFGIVLLWVMHVVFDGPAGRWLDGSHARLGSASSAGQKANGPRSEAWGRADR